MVRPSPASPSHSPSLTPARLPTAEGCSPLHLAAAAGELGTVRLLVENGSSVSLKSLSGRTPADAAKDEATLLVLQGTAPPVTPPPAAKAEAALPATLPADLADWLAGLSLTAYAEPLGLAGLADVAMLAEEDLKEAGLKPAERKRFLAAAKKVAAE